MAYKLIEIAITKDGEYLIQYIGMTGEQGGIAFGPANYRVNGITDIPNLIKSILEANDLEYKARITKI